MDSLIRLRDAAAHAPVQSDAGARASASGRASRATCTTRCSRAFTALLLRFQSVVESLSPARRRRQAASPARNARSTRRRRRSPKGAMPCRGLRCVGDDGERPRQRYRRDRRGAHQRSPAVDAARDRRRGRRRLGDAESVVREEAYRIAGEAVRNAFKHAEARRTSLVTDPLRAHGSFGSSVS